jgi:4-diphosphocytidyl-2-C-methyl-D-erythritol kinase
MRDVSTNQIRVRVPSKINLFLGVRGVREDGYHDLVTVLQTVSIHDTIAVEVAGAGVSMHPSARRFMRVELAIDGVGGVPADDSNLILQAARRLMDHIGIGADHEAVGAPDAVTRLRLTKRIPVAAGMAGGSADAAATLVALNHLWGSGLNRDDLRDLAEELGADVPFCLYGGTALGTGTGARTVQVLTRGIGYWVVGISAQPLSTPEVFRRFDVVSEPSHYEPDAVLAAVRAGDVDALGAALWNDLEVAAFDLMPQLRQKRDAMLQAGALGAIVSGSGPTIVALAPDARSAVRIAEQIEGVFDRVEIAFGPAGGPELSAT